MSRPSTRCSSRARRRCRPLRRAAAAGHLPRVAPGRRSGIDQPGPDGRLLRRQRPLRTHPAVLQRLRGGWLQPARDEASLRALRRSAGRERPLPGRRRPAGAGRILALGGARVQPLLDASGTVRRLASIAVALVVVAVAGGLFMGSSSGSGGNYTVRAIFDDAAFAVTGEEVRIAGAPVGTIGSLSVCLP